MYSEEEPEFYLDSQYQNKRIKLITNSTYIEDFYWYDEETKEANFMEWLSQMVGH